jgi:hypothetical protein
MVEMYVSDVTDRIAVNAGLFVCCLMSISGVSERARSESGVLVEAEERERERERFLSHYYAAPR